MVTQGFRLKRTDALFFLPAILYQLHRIPFSLLTNTEKLQVVERALQETKNVAAEPEGWLPVGWAALFRIVVGISFIIAQFVLLSKWKKQLALEPGLIEKNAENIRWLNWFTGVLIFSYALLLLETLLHLGSNITVGPIIVLTICLSVLFIASYLFARPVILYGMVGWIPTNETILVHSESAEDAEIKKTHLSIDDGKKYKEIIETHLKENKPFCRQGYGIRDLAQEVNLPLYQVSAFINQEYGKNFNEWINDHRFAYLQKLTQDEKDFHRYTLEALGKMAGFNSRTSYITAIKKRTGKTPSAFFKKADSEETESFSNT
ncbi:MAG: helix-turn-helix domain-containing protein [bacterium]